MIVSRWRIRQRNRWTIVLSVINSDIITWVLVSSLSVLMKNKIILNLLIVESQLFITWIISRFRKRPLFWKYTGRYIKLFSYIYVPKLFFYFSSHLTPYGIEALPKLCLILKQLKIENIHIVKILDENVVMADI
jgi:hypothetical protein